LAEKAWKGGNNEWGRGGEKRKSEKKMVGEGQDGKNEAGENMKDGVGRKANGKAIKKNKRKALQNRSND
jgi:hypothetical protein